MEKAADILRLQSFSLIFLDFFLPDSSGLKSFTELKEINSTIPVIILSGLSDTQIAMNAISMGALDFLIKGEYTVQSLEKAISYSIERKRNLEIIEQNNERHNLISKATNDIIWEWNLVTDKVVWMGQGLENFLPHYINQKTVPGNFWASSLHPEERRMVIGSLKEAIASGGDTWQIDHRFLKKDGSYAYMNARGYITKSNTNTPVRIIGSMQDIT